MALDSVNARESSQLLKALDAYRSCGLLELRLGAIASLLEALVLFEHSPDLWSTLIEQGLPRILTEMQEEQARFFNAALKAASVAKSS